VEQVRAGPDRHGATGLPARTGRELVAAAGIGILVVPVTGDTGVATVAAKRVANYLEDRGWGRPAAFFSPFGPTLFYDVTVSRHTVRHLLDQIVSYLRRESPPCPMN
jgi:hypothetical protein